MVPLNEVCAAYGVSANTFRKKLGSWYGIMLGNRKRLRLMDEKELEIVRSVLGEPENLKRWKRSKHS